MYLTKFRQIATPQSRMNMFFDDFPVRDFFNTNFNLHGSWPAANVKENQENFFIELAAPGLSKSDFQVNVDKDTLNISVEKSKETTNENERYTRKEFRYHGFSRSFILPENVENNNISAAYENGVLTLTIPKKAAENKDSVRKIEVS